MTTRILIGDCRDVLAGLPEKSVHCCITSAPYWGLRSYLPADHPQKHREIGSEPTLQAWVDTMVEVFRGVRRVLRDDGVLFLNLGDAYAGSGRGGDSGTSTMHSPQPNHSQHQAFTGAHKNASHAAGRSNVAGLKPKDLMGQPWRVAFALQADGWWWRDTIVWHKKNPMPSSVTDRCTPAWEPVLMMSKSARYWFDAEAIKEPAGVNTHARRAQPTDGQQADIEGVGRRQGPPGNPAENELRWPAGWAKEGTHTASSHQTAESHPKAKPPHGSAEARKLRANSSAKSAPTAAVNGMRKLAEVGSGTKNNDSFDAAMAVMPERANKRNVWSIASEPFREAHFATFPTALVEPCVLAGCPEGGTILDPFGGSGTVAIVADRHHRNSILIDLDERNAPMAERRLMGDAPLFAQVTE